MITQIIEEAMEEREKEREKAISKQLYFNNRNTNHALLCEVMKGGFRE